MTEIYKEYITSAGNTFDSLALAVYGEEKLAHTIIGSNPDYSDVVMFTANVVLNLPVVENVQTSDTLPPWRR